MLPERPLFDIVDKSDGAEIHVLAAFSLHHQWLRHICRIRRIWRRSLTWQIIARLDGWCVLCAAEYIWQKRVVIQTPDSMRAGRLQSVDFDEPSYELKISVSCQRNQCDIPGNYLTVYVRLDHAYDDSPFLVSWGFTSPEPAQFPYTT